MKAIIAKYKLATLTRPASVTATTGDRRNTFTVTYGQRAGDLPWHDQAAVGLCQKMGWPGPLMRGGLENGDQVFVFDDAENRITFGRPE